MEGAPLKSTTIKKIGISTCGGDCPGLNPVIRWTFSFFHSFILFYLLIDKNILFFLSRAIVWTAILNYGWEVIGIEDSTCGLLDLNYRGPHGNFKLDLQSVDEIISKGYFIFFFHSFSLKPRISFNFFPFLIQLQKVELFSDQVISHIPFVMQF